MNLSPQKKEADCFKPSIRNGTEYRDHHNPFNFSRGFRACNSVRTINNYSAKALPVTIDFCNKAGKLCESDAYFVPKFVVYELNFLAITIPVKHFFIKVNGQLRRYCVDKAFSPPDRVNVLLDTFLDEPFLRLAPLNVQSIGI